MNGQQTSLLLSILLHGVIGCSIYYMGDIFVHPVKAIVVDLTVSPGGPSGEASSAKRDKPASRKSADRRKAALKEQRTIARPVAPKIQEKVPDRMPEHSMESARTTVVPARGPVGPTSSQVAAASWSTGGNDGTADAGKVGKTAVAGEGVGGRGDSREQLRNGYLKELFAYIKDIIQRNISYPSRARRMGWTGRVVVSFVINENGCASDEKVLVSSGFEVLDSNVIATIKAVSPFPRPPVKAELHVPIIYRLE
jgi:protein TonB